MADGVVVVAPFDGFDLIGIDLETGSCLWNLSNYELNKRVSVRAGYNLLWIEGVALAPDQLDFTFTSTSGTALNDGGGVFLHGVSVGIEARF